MPKSFRTTREFDTPTQPEENADVESLHFSKCGQSQSNPETVPITIAHISDPHLSRRYYREHIKSLKIVLREILRAGCDHIVISGDLVSTADPDDFYLAREVFLNYGLMNSRLLTIVPGNHDIFGGPHRAVDVVSFPRHIRSVDYRRNLDLFHETFREAFDGVRHLSNDSFYPFIKNVGPFAFVGLNSIPPWSLRTNPLGTNGLIDDSQLNVLRSADTLTHVQSAIPVAVVHHHFNDLTDDSVEEGIWKRIESRTMRMKKRKRLLKVLKAIGVKYVLHGHIHRNELYERNGIQLANGAGAVCDDPVKNLKYNTLASSNGSCELSTRHLAIPFQDSSVTLALVRRPAVSPTTPGLGERLLHVPAVLGSTNKIS